MIYLDNAATTKIYNECIDEMLPYFAEAFYNPGANYTMAVNTLRKVEEVEANILKILGQGSSRGKIIFSSGASEANNQAIIGYLRANKEKGKHVIVSSMEHHSVLNAVKAMEKEGFEISYIYPDKDGTINPLSVSKAIRPDTILVSVMYVNNEIGTVSNIKEIVDSVRKNSNGKYIAVHTDAVQAVGYMDINVGDLDVDMLTASAHKFRGPKGVGFLFVKDKIKLAPIIFGGSQQNNLRAGTLNVPGIIGMEKALSLSSNKINENVGKFNFLRKLLLDEIMKKTEGVYINGSTEKTFSKIVSLRIDDVDATRLQSALDHEKVMVGIGATCTDSYRDISHVLKAIGLNEKEAKSTIRISFADYNTEKEVLEAAGIINEKVQFLRRFI